MYISGLIQTDKNWDKNEDFYSMYYLTHLMNHFDEYKRLNKKYGDKKFPVGHKYYLQDLKNFFQKTIIFVTHDMAEAFKLGDQIVVLQQGKIEQIGTKDELSQFPKTHLVNQMVNVGFRKASHLDEA